MPENSGLTRAGRVNEALLAAYAAGRAAARHFDRSKPRERPADPATRRSNGALTENEHWHH